MDYDNFIAVDWAMTNMAVARHSKVSTKPWVKDVPASLIDLKAYLKTPRGRTALTIEETTTAH